MNSLTVFYDARCGLCCALREWIPRQPMIVPIDCRPEPGAATDLRILADTGEEWVGDAAWLMVLWALRDYRPLAYRLASPALLATARHTFALLSHYRGTISCALGLAPEVPSRHAV